MREPKLVLGPDLVKLVAEIDEFKGRWEALSLAARLDRERIVRSSEADLPELSIQVLDALRAKERLNDHAACVNHRRKSEHTKSASARAGRSWARAAARQGARHMVFTMSAEPPTIDQAQTTGIICERPQNFAWFLGAGASRSAGLAS